MAPTRRRNRDGEWGNTAGEAGPPAGSRLSNHLFREGIIMGLTISAYAAAGDFNLDRYLYGLTAFQNRDAGGIRTQLFYNAARTGAELSATVAAVGSASTGVYGPEPFFGHLVLQADFQRGFAVEAIAISDGNGPPPAQVLVDGITAHRTFGQLKAALLAGDDTIGGYIGDDVLEGMAGQDTLHGDLGHDRLDGGLGDDTLYGDEGEDLCFGGAGDDLLFGGEGADTLGGATGNDWLYGGTDADVLTGGLGRDTFHLGDPRQPGRPAPVIAPDTITDFTVRQDKIELDPSVFRAVRNGLVQQAFVVGTQAQDGRDHVIYDPASGNLFYDADGAGGAAQTLIAHLSRDLALSHTDFIVGGLT